MSTTDHSNSSQQGWDKADLFFLADALKRGMSIEEIADAGRKALRQKLPRSLTHNVSRRSSNRARTRCARLKGAVGLLLHKQVHARNCGGSGSEGWMLRSLPPKRALARLTDEWLSAEGEHGG